MGLGAGALSLSVPLSLRVSDFSWGSVRNVGFLGPASGAVLRRPRASNAGAARTGGRADTARRVSHAELKLP